MRVRTIAVIADDESVADKHYATCEVLRQAADEIGIKVQIARCSTDKFHVRENFKCDGIVLSGGLYKNFENAARIATTARYQRIPLLGTGMGFQCLAIELLRSIAGFEAAAHEEYDPGAELRGIVRLSSSAGPRPSTVFLGEGTAIRRYYGVTSVQEPFFNQYGIASAYYSVLERSPGRPSGWDEHGSIVVLECADHPFFIGTLFMPQLAKSESAHPLVAAFVRVVIGS